MTGVGLTGAMIALAVVVVVPLAVPLHPGRGRTAVGATVLAGMVAAASLLAQQGRLAAALAVPWLLVTCAGAGAAAWRWWRNGRALHDVVWALAPAYLVVGALWLLADRLGIEPAGFGPPFVLLTAVHFHYAGFAATTLAGTVRRWCPRRRAAGVALAAIATAPPVVAAGFVFLGWLQVAGAMLLTAGLWTMAWVVVRHAVGRVGRPAGVLLTISSVATVVPMILAVQWAIGTNYGTPALPIPEMVRFHGVVNALGFTLPGVLGWRLAGRS